MPFTCKPYSFTVFNIASTQVLSLIVVLSNLLLCLLFCSWFITVWCYQQYLWSTFLGPYLLLSAACSPFNCQPLVIFLKPLLVIPKYVWVNLPWCSCYSGTFTWTPPLLEHLAQNPWPTLIHLSLPVREHSEDNPSSIKPRNQVSFQDGYL